MARWGTFFFYMVQKIDSLISSAVEHNPWTALIDSLWAEIIQHVDAA